MGMPPPALLAGEGLRERVAEAVERLRRFHEVRARHGVEPLPSERRLRQALERARLGDDALDQALSRGLGHADLALAPGISRFGLYRAMLRHGVTHVDADALDWLAAETDALTRLRDDLPGELRHHLIDDATRRLEAALASDGGAVACARLLTSAHLPDEVSAALARELDLECERKALRRALAKTPERLCAKAMFEACYARAQGAHHSVRPGPVRVELHRDVLCELFDDDTDALVSPALTRLGRAFLGTHEPAGFYATVRARHVNARFRPFAFERKLAEGFRAPRDASTALCTELEALGVHEADAVDYLEKLALTLPDLLGAFAERETTRPGQLLEFLAVLVLYEHAALRTSSARSRTDLRGLLDTLPPRPLAGEHPRELAFRMVQAAQLSGISLGTMLAWTRAQASAFVHAVQSFDAMSSRRVLSDALLHAPATREMDALLRSARRRPRRARNWLFRARDLTRPLLGLATSLEQLEARWLTLLSDKRARPSLRPSVRTLRPSQRVERP